MQSTKITDVTRRRFIAAGAIAGAGLAAGCWGRQRNSWMFLNENNARTLAAMCDQIIPADKFPSASEAGVLNYIDIQLTRHYRRHQKAYAEGLAHADSTSIKRFGLPLADASPNQQLEVVGAAEKNERKFFELVRNHTMEGYYGSPRHGGNRDAVSWRMVGLSEPPLLGRAQYDFTKGPRS